MCKSYLSCYEDKISISSTWEVDYEVVVHCNGQPFINIKCNVWSSQHPDKGCPILQVPKYYRGSWQLDKLSDFLFAVFWLSDPSLKGGCSSHFTWTNAFENVWKYHIIITRCNIFMHIYYMTKLLPPRLKDKIVEKLLKQFTWNTFRL